MLTDICLEPGCGQAAEGLCNDCREEYCGEHLEALPGYVTSRACPACRQERLEDEPHGSDCAAWSGERCDCVMSRLEADEAAA